MTRTLVTLAAASLTGCAAYVPFENPNEARTRVVTWRTVDDADQYCRSKMDTKPLPYPLIEIKGCAEYTKRSCTIYTNKSTDLHVLGHEVRHCFDGAFHE